MAYPLKKTNLVIRANFGDESIALIQAFYERKDWRDRFHDIYIVYVDTGWSAYSWAERVEKAFVWVKACGFQGVTLHSPATFEALVLSRKQFPSLKFQWCAGFLKGLPLMSWLDEQDPLKEWCIALPKRQAMTLQKLEEWQEECEFHGHRALWLPNIDLSDEERDGYLTRAGWLKLSHRSLECEPCIHMQSEDLHRMSQKDREKLACLEKKIATKMPLMVNSPSASSPQFSMGCGDPFGCGL